MDETTGFVVAGHGRIGALEALKAAGKECPKGILEDNGEWLVPVVRGLRFKNRREAEAYLLADNQTTIVGGWDTEALGRILMKMNPPLQSLTGFTSFEIKGLVSRITVGADEKQPVPAPPENPVSSRGEVWQLGEHRIMCGDATSPEDIQRLMDGKKAAVIVTDPPYGVSYDNSSHFLVNPVTKESDHHDKDWGDIEGDQNLEVAVKALPLIMSSLCDDGSAYICCGTKLAVSIVNWLEANHVKYSPFLVWYKPHFVVTWQRYHANHELIVYCGPGSGPTHGSRWFGPNNERTVWELPQVLGPERQHPTQKLVAIYERAIRNSTLRGEIILDPFLGSGTAIIAAEKMGRICYGMEIDPRYVDVAVKRWMNYTGKKATKINES